MVEDSRPEFKFEEPLCWAQVWEIIPGPYVRPGPSLEFFADALRDKSPESADWSRLAAARFVEFRR